MIGLGPFACLLLAFSTLPSGFSLPQDGKASPANPPTCNRSSLPAVVPTSTNKVTSSTLPTASPLQQEEPVPTPIHNGTKTDITSTTPTIAPSAYPPTCNRSSLSPVIPTSSTLLPTGSSLPQAESVPTPISNGTKANVTPAIAPSAYPPTCNRSSLSPVIPTSSTLLPTGSLLPQEEPEPTPISNGTKTNITSTTPTITPSAYPTSTTPTIAPSAPPTSTSLPASSNSSTSGSNTTSDSQAFLLAHNSFRAQHGAAPLTWNGTLASKAQEWASKCRFAHSKGANKKFGENLDVGPVGYTIQAAVMSWANELQYYDPKHPDPSHSTQVVWKSTTQLGCVRNTCDKIFHYDVFRRADFIVCGYYPPGNVVNQFGTNVQV